MSALGCSTIRSESHFVSQKPVFVWQVVGEPRRTTQILGIDTQTHFERDSNVSSL